MPPTREKRDVALLLTILTVLAVWAFLAVLALGLLLIRKPLESIRGYLEKIAMGVRAIEQQTAPLGGAADALAASLADGAATVGSVARRMREVETRVDGPPGVDR